MNKYIAILLLVVSGSAVADLNKGLDAYANKDYETAVKEWELSAAQGDAFSQTILARMYQSGKGVDQDLKKAGKLYKLAAAQGYPGAQVNLGYMHYTGEGVLQDYKEAFKLFMLAAEQENEKAQNNLGLAYENGTGIDLDQVKAHMWYNLAASQGNDEAAVSRDRLNTSMLPADVSKAQAMARACLANDYKGC